MQHSSLTLFKQGLVMSRDRNPSINKSKSMTLKTTDFINFTWLKLSKKPQIVCAVVIVNNGTWKERHSFHLSHMWNVNISVLFTPGGGGGSLKTWNFQVWGRSTEAFLVPYLTMALACWTTTVQKVVPTSVASALDLEVHYSLRTSS